MSSEVFYALLESALNLKQNMVSSHSAQGLAERSDGKVDGFYMEVLIRTNGIPCLNFQPALQSARSSQNTDVRLKALIMEGATRF